MHLGLFGCHTSQWITGRTSAKVRAMKSRRNFSQRTHPIHPVHRKLTFWCVLFYLVAFGTVWLPYETRCKTGRTTAKFVPRSRVGIFRNERIQSTPLHLQLMFWCVSFYLAAFGTVWLPYETRYKKGRTSAKVSATKSLRNFSQRTHPIHPIRP